MQHGGLDAPLPLQVRLHGLQAALCRTASGFREHLSWKTVAWMPHSPRRCACIAPVTHRLRCAARPQKRSCCLASLTCSSSHGQWDCANQCSETAPNLAHDPGTGEALSPGLTLSLDPNPCPRRERCSPVCALRA